MICQPCRDGVHEGTPKTVEDMPCGVSCAALVPEQSCDACGRYVQWPQLTCPGEGHCDCQHRPITYAGTCGAGEQPCGQPARLYACGWRCDGHKP